MSTKENYHYNPFLAEFLTQQKHIEEKEVPSSNNRMLLVCASYEDGAVLYRTLNQLSFYLKLSIIDHFDIIVSLDNGGGSSRDAIEGKYTTLSDDIPMKHSDHNRLFVYEHTGKQGKGFALNSVITFLQSQSTYNPKWIMIFDSETRLYSKGCTNNDNPIDQLIAICNQTKKETVISAEQQICAYAEGIPQNTPTANPILNFYNAFNSRPDVNKLLGGCLMGETSTLLPLLRTVYALLPGCPTEDSLAKIIGNEIGLNCITDHNIIFTNEAPENDVDIQDLMILWVKNKKAMIQKINKICPDILIDNKGASKYDVRNILALLFIASIDIKLFKYIPKNLAFLFTLLS